MSEGKYFLEFIIYDLPEMTNTLARRHWRVQLKHKDKWHTLVTKEVFYAQRKIPVSPIKRAKLTLCRYSAKCPDFDGLVSSFKNIIDSLIKLKVLENDSMEHIGQSSYEWFKAAPRKGHIRVRVEEQVD